MVGEGEEESDDPDKDDFRREEETTGNEEEDKEEVRGEGVDDEVDDFRSLESVGREFDRVEFFGLEASRRGRGEEDEEDEDDEDEE